MAVRSKTTARVTNRPVVAVSGPTGPAGGPIGPAGSTGPSVTGPTGLRGPTGPFGTGPTGVGAFTGPTGPRSTGPTGFGLPGATGDYGDNGPDGPTGAIGAVGKTGSAGPAASPTGPASGLTGPTGAGSICVPQVPFFADPNVWLTFPLFDTSDGFGSGTTTAGIIYLIPVFVPYPRTYTAMAVEPGDPGPFGGGIQARVGIYDCTQDMHPTVPLYDSGNTIIRGPGLFSFSFSVALAQKPYFLAFWSLSGFTGKTVDLSEIVCALGMQKYADNSRWMFNQNFMQFNRTYSGSFPDLTTLTPTAVNAGNYIVQGIR
jgi:hypothetical protein